MKLKFQISEGNGYSINDVGNIAIGKEKSSYSSPSAMAAMLNAA